MSKFIGIKMPESLLARTMRYLNVKSFETLSGVIRRSLDEYLERWENATGNRAAPQVPGTPYHPPEAYGSPLQTVADAAGEVNGDQADAGELAAAPSGEKPFTQAAARDNVRRRLKAEQKKLTSPPAAKPAAKRTRKGGKK